MKKNTLKDGLYAKKDAKRDSKSSFCCSVIRLFRLLHSWIWFEMWVALFFLKVDNKSVPKSYRTGSWKWLRNALAKSQKLLKAAEGSSIYHFSVVLVKVLWNSLNLTESSFSEFEEHHKWNVVAWAPGSSPTLPLNLGMSDGNLVGTGGHKGSCLIGSFINFDKFGPNRCARCANLGIRGTYPRIPIGKSGLAPYHRLQSG